MMIISSNSDTYCKLPSLMVKERAYCAQVHILRKYNNKKRIIQKQIFGAL